ncbi:Acyl-CoA desaturase 1 [Spathaspora sp. JA1]|nr:Acyl-CoA desaturase 1 [Spathaspora sp. JA1]
MSDKPVTTKVQRRKPNASTTANPPTGTPDLIRKRHLLKRINYFHTITTIILPLLSIAYILHSCQGIIPKNISTLYFTCIYYNITMLSFTSAYHKYYAHNSFKVNYPWLIQFWLIFASSIGLGTAKWWAGLHRAHHRFVDDVEKDPYSIKRGFWFAHWGWILYKPKNVPWFTQFIDQEFSPQLPEESEETVDLGSHIDETSRNLLIWQERTYLDFKRIAQNNQEHIYIVIQNIIHDITPFMDQHPGGVALLRASHGKDATKAFYGGVYGHSTAAQNLLATMRIGVLDVGNDEEVWKRVVREEGDETGDVNKGGQYKTAEAA